MDKITFVFRLCISAIAFITFRNKSPLKFNSYLYDGNNEKKLNSPRRKLRIVIVNTEQKIAE